MSPSRTGGCPKPDQRLSLSSPWQSAFGKIRRARGSREYRTCHPERSEGSHGSAGDRTITLRAITSFVRSLACARDDEHRGLRVTAVLPMIPCAGNGRCRLGSIKRRAASGMSHRQAWAAAGGHGARAFDQTALRRAFGEGTDVSSAVSRRR